MSYLEPHQYKKRVLLLVSGMSPQIVTETLYALTQSTQPAFIPTEVHLITTYKGAEQARLNLLVGAHPYFYELCEDYNLDKSIFCKENIHIIQNHQGQLLEDIRTEEENEATADFITKIMHRFTQDADTALHVSIAGGRKTMGYYAGYALSLYGRTQDRLSHVLVSEGYESLREFYYPTPYSHPVYGHKDEALDAQKAEVTLAQIPFIPLRGGVVSTKLLQGDLGFNETVERALQAATSPTLLLNPIAKTMQVGTITGKLKPASVTMLLWFNHRLQRGKKELFRIVREDYNSDYAQEIIKAADYYDFVINQRTLANLSAANKGVDNSFLETQISRLKTDLDNQLGHELAKCFHITFDKTRGAYLLPESFNIKIQEENF